MLERSPGPGPGPGPGQRHGAVAKQAHWEAQNSALYLSLFLHILLTLYCTPFPVIA